MKGENKMSNNARILLKANKLMNKYYEQSKVTNGKEWADNVNKWFAAQTCANEAMTRMSLADWHEYENER